MLLQDPLPVYIGWDKREEQAYNVCAHSLMARTTIPLRVTPLRIDTLREYGLFTRPQVEYIDLLDSKPFSTDFAFTRFLVPSLTGHKGWALFCDCDFLFMDDVAKLVELADEQYAVMVVKHDHRPRETVKMDDKVQSVYPRKNWSSLILWNCGHVENKKLDATRVNLEPGSYLHQFQWLPDECIGELPGEWNFLEGWSKGHASAVHYTRGGPWFPKYEDVGHADSWRKEFVRTVIG